jgi:hypothetical protein
MSTLDNQTTPNDTNSQSTRGDSTMIDTIPAEEPEKGTDCASELKAFFDSIGFTETARAFETELIVLSDANRAKIPQYTLQLINNLLCILEQDKSSMPLSENNVDGKGEDTTNGSKRKRSDEEEQDAMEQRFKRISPEQVQIRATDGELRKRIDNFIQAKKSEVDASNRKEFLRRKESGDNEVTCARTDAREIDRNIQMKFDVVNNEDGSLARSLVTSANHVNLASTVHKVSGADERLQNLEQHLNILYKNNSRDSFSLFERIKIIEDTIVQIENQNPLWAAVHFNQPNRAFPPPPVVNLITPNDSITDNTAEEKSYTSAAISPAQQAPLKPTGRANSSLTRAVIEQLARRQKQPQP